MTNAVQNVDDGMCALTWESVVGVVRLLDSLPGPVPGTTPAYRTCGHALRLSSTIVKLYGFSGTLSRRQMWLICDLLRRQGYAIAYIERAAGHSIPWGECIESGDWAGTWRVNLDAIIGRRRTDPA